MDINTKFFVVEFTKYVLITGEEMDWSIDGVIDDVYAFMKPGDKLAVTGLFEKYIIDGYFITFNSNFGDDLAQIEFNNIPPSSFKIISDGEISLDDIIEQYKIRDWSSFSYSKNKLKDQIKGHKYIENKETQDN